MSPAFSIALLLLSATVVAPLVDQTEEEEDLPSQLEQERADHYAKEILQDGDSQDLCGGCKSLVTKVKKKMGDDTSKDEVAKMVQKVCSQEGDELIKAVCKKITGKMKNKLSEAIADGRDPKCACKKVKLCKKKTPPNP